MRGFRQAAETAAVAVLAFALGLALAAAANAGGPINPTPGDKQLGGSGGIRYVADASRTSNNETSMAYTGCPKPGHKWRLTAGGFAAGAAITGVSGSQPQDLFSSLGDNDADPDDYWRTEVESSSSGARYTGYAVCAKLKALSYNEVRVPDGLVTPTTATDSCPGRSVPTGGGGSSGFGGEPIISMFPDRNDWTLVFNGVVDDSVFAFNNFICLGPKGLRTETKSTKLGSLASKSVVATCSGKREVIGGGIEVGFPSAAVAFASFPVDDADKGKVPDDGWRVGAQSMTTQKQTLRAYAICKG